MLPEAQPEPTPQVWSPVETKISKSRFWDHPAGMPSLPALARVQFGKARSESLSTGGLVPGLRLSVPRNGAQVMINR